MASEVYGEFIERVKEINRANTIEAILAWDQETYMPKRGAGDRANQMALIAGIAHEKLTSDAFAGLLARVEKEQGGGGSGSGNAHAGSGGGDAQDFAAATNVREMRRIRDRAAKIPTELVQRLARTSAMAKEAWQEARKESKFAAFAPHLQELLDIKRQIADLIGWKTEPYDALMDEFEPGARAADVQRVFDQLKAELVPLVAAIKNAPRQPDLSILKREYPQGGQAAFGRRVIEAMGFDFEAGRIDISTHPFCSGHGPADVRLTTRYDVHWLPASLFGTMHEAGHGLYEQGFDAANVNTPMAWAVSLGIHESQSRMWENMVGRGRPFWEHWYPQLQQQFPAVSDVKLDDFHFAINTVRPSLIRVEADEVTYNLHIMLRFDIERRMISGQMAVKDIPEVWNTAMKEYFGITPPNDAQGCLQDIHWSMAIFGYFPTYALGNLYAAQFFSAARRAMPDLDERIRKGEMRTLREWLREKIHKHGMRYRAGELVKLVAGEPLSHVPFVEYLKAKFSPLYGI